MTGRARAILYALDEYAAPITVATLKEITGRTSFIYGTARRLEALGYLTSFERGTSMSVIVARGGRPRRYYALTSKARTWLAQRPVEIP